MKQKKKARELELEGEELLGDEDEEDERKENKTSKTPQVPTQIIEREVNLSLINDKLNFIISQLQQKK